MDKIFRTDGGGLEVPNVDDISIDLSLKNKTGKVTAELSDGGRVEVIYFPPPPA